MFAQYLRRIRKVHRKIGCRKERRQYLLETGATTRRRPRLLVGGRGYSSTTAATRRRPRLLVDDDDLDLLDAGDRAETVGQRSDIAPPALDDEGLHTGVV